MPHPHTHPICGELLPSLLRPISYTPIERIGAGEQQLKSPEENT